VFIISFCALLAFFVFVSLMILMSLDDDFEE